MKHVGVDAIKIRTLAADVPKGKEVVERHGRRFDYANECLGLAELKDFVDKARVSTESKDCNSTRTSISGHSTASSPRFLFATSPGRRSTSSREAFTPVATVTDRCSRSTTGETCPWTDSWSTCGTRTHSRTYARIWLAVNSPRIAGNRQLPGGEKKSGDFTLQPAQGACAQEPDASQIDGRLGLTLAYY